MHDHTARGAETGRRKAKRASLRGLTWIVVAAVVGVLVVASWVPIHNRFVPKQFGVVEPGRIYRSGQISASIIRDTLAHHGIRTIVALQDYDPNEADHRAEREAARSLGIREFHLHLEGDGRGDIHHYATALAEMARADRARAPILVHCAAGTQRTGAAVAFYRVLVQHRSAAQARSELRARGWDPDDNPVLIPYMNEHMQELAQLLVDAHVIDHVPEPLPVMKP